MSTMQKNDLLQLRGGAFTRPVAFQRPLQLTPLADARVSRDGSQGHVHSSVS